jgi:hypothetical protein
MPASLSRVAGLSGLQAENADKTRPAKTVKRRFGRNVGSFSCDGR